MTDDVRRRAETPPVARPGRLAGGGVALLAVVAMLAAEAVRTSGPLLDHVAGVGGVPAAAVAALTVYVAPVLVAPVARWLGPARATAAVVAALVVLRLVAQVQPAPDFAVAMLTAVAGIGALVLVTDRVISAGPGGGVRAAVGIVLGGALDVAVRGIADTWDTVWRPGALPWLYAAALCVVTVVLLVRAYPGFDRGAARPALRLGIVGVYLALYTLFLGSPAFVASQAGLGLPWAVVVLLIGGLLAVEAVSRLRLPGGSGRLPELSGRLGGGVAALAAVLATLGALFAGGILVVPLIVVAQVAVAILLARAFTASDAGVPADAGPEDHRPDDHRPDDHRPDDADRPAAGRRPSPRPAVSAAGRRPSPRPTVRASSLARTRTPEPARPAPLPAVPVTGYVLAGLGAGLGFVIVVLGYQMTYELPLPFDNRLLPIAGAALLGLAGLGLLPSGRPAPAAATDRVPGGSGALAASGASTDRGATLTGRAPGARHGAGTPTGSDGPVHSDRPTTEAPAGLRASRLRDAWRRPASDTGARPGRGRFAPLAGIPAVLLLVPVLMLVTTPAPAAATRSADTLRMVTWNLHYGVNNDAAVDPGTVATVLRGQRPDVVLLQEVNRGWPIGSGVDMAEYLSRALRMPYVWSPAADGQFGNVILSSLPLSDVHTGRLPYGAGPQRRSYASARVELASGQTVTFLTAHLQDHTDNHRTRIDEIDTMLRSWHRASPAVIAGDFNSMPGWPELTEFDKAGLSSAQDSTGHAGLLSSPTDHPVYRPDWIFGTSDVSFTDFGMPDTQASDHFPLAVTLHLG